jgi:hypothetical protein
MSKAGRMNPQRIVGNGDPADRIHSANCSLPAVTETSMSFTTIHRTRMGLPSRSAPCSHPRRLVAFARRIRIRSSLVRQKWNDRRAPARNWSSMGSGALSFQRARYAMIGIRRQTRIDYRSPRNRTARDRRSVAGPRTTVSLRRPFSIPPANRQLTDTKDLLFLFACCGATRSP